MRRDDYVKAIKDQGFKLVYNPPRDGNCQFAALSHLARKIGIFRSPETVRKEIVAYLQSNPYDSDGFPLLEHLAENEFAFWNDYIKHMAQDGTYGDQLTLYAAANLYNIDIHIVSSLGAGGQHVFHSSASNSTAIVYLGHLAENQGKHYVSLEPVMTDNFSVEEEGEGTDLEDLTGEYPGENEQDESKYEMSDDNGDVESRSHSIVDIIDHGVGGLGGIVVDAREVGQTNQTKQFENDIYSQITLRGEEQIGLQFVSDEDVGLLAPTVNGNCNVENLPNEVLEKIFQIVLISAVLCAGNACCEYQSLCRVNRRFREVTERLYGMLPRVHISGGLQSRVVSVRSLIKKYGLSSGLVIELRRIISNPKWADAWLELNKEEYDW